MAHYPPPPMDLTSLIGYIYNMLQNSIDAR